MLKQVQLVSGLNLLLYFDMEDGQAGQFGWLFLLWVGLNELGTADIITL